MNPKLTKPPENIKSAEVSTFGTKQNPETSDHFKDSVSGSIAQDFSLHSPKSARVCDKCGELVDQVYSVKFRAGEVCSNCIFSATTRKAEAPIRVDAEAFSNRIHRLHHCFGCEQPHAFERMSNCLVLCKTCLQKARAETRDRFLEKALLRFTAYVRGRI
jgi:hypothetical protein